MPPREVLGGLVELALASVCLLSSALAACKSEPAAHDGPAPGAALGGIDFQHYCFATGGGTAVIKGDWVCELSTGAARPADANVACRQQYPNANAHAEVARYGDALSYTCYAGLPGELGGMNLDGHCQSIGAKRAFVDGDTATWRCAREGNTAVNIDMNAACRTSYPAAPGATARQLRPGNLTSWVCFRP
jgi:hypothetical protein